MIDVLRQQVIDPIALGDENADTFALGYALTLGDDWPLADARILLCRRSLYPTPGKWEYCGLAHTDAGEIANWPAKGHEADQAYQYAAAVALANGFVSAFSEPVRVEFDDEGALVTPATPNAPTGVTVSALAAGTFCVRWSYDPYGHGADPTDFQVFGGEPGSIDWDTPLADGNEETEVAYVRGRTAYSFVTQAYGDGVERAFGIRGRNADGTAERNTIESSSAIARVDAPADASIRLAHQRRQR